jgi:dephospho-CoA kinase
MIKAGITGGIGSGKSIVCKVFELLGVPVYYADDKAKQILDENASVHNNIVETFGTGILSTDKKIDRKKLASIVFNDQEKLSQLNGIVHPAVAADFIKWCEMHKHHSYILKEAAILFESGAYKNVDRIITVTAPLDIRIKRVMARDNVTQQDVTDRIARQMSDEEKISRSSWVINNDEQQLMIPQIIRIHNELQASN